MTIPAQLFKAAVGAADRRLAPRLVSDDLQVFVRQRRSFFRIPAMAIDFNRHGIAVLSSRALRVDSALTVELRHHQAIAALKVIGVVHNCVQMQQGFRCGIRFRPQSRGQFDSEQIEAYLHALEAIIDGGALGSA